MADNKELLKSRPQHDGEPGAAERRRFRCTLDLPTPMEERLNEVCQVTGETRSEVLRRALLIYFKCEEFKLKGYEAGVFKENTDGTWTKMAFVPI